MNIHPPIAMIEKVITTDHATFVQAGRVKERALFSIVSDSEGMRGFVRFSIEKLDQAIVAGLSVAGTEEVCGVIGTITGLVDNV